MSVTTGLIQGPARVYTAAVGATLPTSSDIASLKAGSLSGWSFLGRTTEPVVVTDTPTLVEARSQQTSRALDFAISAWETSFSTTLRDIDAQVVADLIHGTVAGDTVYPGLRGRAQSHSYAIVGPWDGGECLIVVERAVVENGLELPFNNEEYSTVEFTIRVLEGDNLEGGYELYVVLGGDEEA